MTEIIIRQAILADIDALAILVDQYRQFYGRESDVSAARNFLFERFDHGESVLFIAQADGESMGFAQLYPSFSTAALARTFILNDLFVMEKARRQGVGSSLIDAAIEYGKLSGAARLTLTTAITNTTAQSLYLASGWKRDEHFYVFHYGL